MMMRCLPVCLVCALLATTIARGARVPYAGVINRDGAPALSGPGEEYYATDTMRHGDRVEVYRIDEGGWCAIRPPTSSFSWVAAPYLRETDTPHVAEVVDDDVLAYVGSRVRKDRDVVQIRLNRGELVEIVGFDEMPDLAGNVHPWYRIAPPAGEFRWVHLEYVDRAAADEPAQDPGVAEADNPALPDVWPLTPQTETGRATTPMAATVAARRRAAVRPATDPTPDEAGKTKSGAELAPKVLAAQWKPLPPGTLARRAARSQAGPKPRFIGATRRAKNGPWAGTAGDSADRVVVAGLTRDRVGVPGCASEDEAPPRLLGRIEAAPLTPGHSAVRQAGATSPVTVDGGPAAEGSLSHEDQLAQLDVEFSLMVSKPAPQWQLEPLMLRADSISRLAPEPLTRGRARMLLEKMRQFEQLQKGSSPLGEVLTPSMAAGGQVGYVAASTAMPVAAQPPAVMTVRTGTPPAGGRLPNLLTALESLMPPAPGPPGPVATVMPSVAPAPNPLVAATSMQTPETAPPAPGELSWGTAPEPSVRIIGSPAGPGTAIGSGVAADGSSGWQPPAAAPPTAAPPPLQPGGNSTGMLGQISDKLLYPFGPGHAAPAATGAYSPGYDGQGWLMPIVSRQGSVFAQRNYMPPFALTDRDGNILQFVTPAPGVNLHRYLQQEIGVFGQQQPMAHLGQPHVTASRVVALDRHRR